MNVKRTVLFLPRHMTSWHELIQIARALKHSQKLKPVILLCTPQMVSMKVACEDEGLCSIDISSDLEQAEQKP